MITVYEYIAYTQGWVVEKLKKLGLVTGRYSAPHKLEMTFADAARLMRHDSHKRIRGAIRQMGSGVVIR